jgi:PAS domain S-box-containing protein
MSASLTPPNEATPALDEALFRQIVESATDYAIVTMGLDGRITSWNAGARSLLGYEKGEILGQDCAILFTPEDRDEGIPEARRQRALAEGRAQEEERWYRRKDGSRVWGSGLLMILRDPEAPEGTPLGFVKFLRDRTERKLAERRLRDSEERYRTLFDSIDEGFCVIAMLFGEDGTPQDYRFVETNPAFERQTGLRDAVGRRVRELVPDLEPHWFTTYGRVAMTGEPVRFVDEARSMDGRWFDVYAFRVGDPALRRVALLFTDISERRRLETDLHRRVAELAEADRRKNDFLAMLAHELRNPLAAIQGAIRVAQRPESEAERDDAQEVIDRQSRHLARLIDDLLDVSRISRGKVEVRREPIDAAAILPRAVEAVRPLVDAKHHTLRVRNTGGSLPVLADPTRLEQIFTNLLTNAAKYTDPGGRLDVEACRQGDEVVVSIRDNGVGIAPEMLPKVFDLFIQVDRSLARSEGGLGIGLTLVQQLVERHGGRVEADSVPGLGSVFVVRLPALATALPAPPKPAPRLADASLTIAGRGRRLLLVDDNLDTARLTGRLLRSQGFQVQMVHDGPSALHAAMAERPDFVLLDIGLPGLDGYEIARLLRREEALAHTRIIAVSGYGDAPSRAQGRAAGFDHHLVKPLDFAVLARILGESSSPPEPPRQDDAA